MKRKIKVTKLGISLHDGKLCEAHKHIEGNGFDEKKNIKLDVAIMSGINEIIKSNYWRHMW